MPTPEDKPDASPPAAVPDQTRPDPDARGKLTRGERLWVHARLRALDWTQQEFANRMGVTHPAVVKWLSGQNGLGGPQRRRLLDVFDAATGPAAPPPAGAVAPPNWNLEVAPPVRLPVYPGNAPGSPAARERPPVPESLRCPPPLLEGLIGPGGFAVRVRDGGLLRRPGRPVEVGAFCWVAPAALDLVRPGALVVAEVRGAAHPTDAGLTVRVLGPERATLLRYKPDGAPHAVACAGFDVLGAVVRIELSLPPE